MVDYTDAETVMEHLSWARQIPDHDNGSHNLEVSDNSSTLTTASTFYLAHSKVIPGTETIYYGNTENTCTAATRNVDYQIDYDIGKITVLSGTKFNAVSALTAYKYSSIDARPGIKGSTVNSIISAVTQKIDGYCNRTFQPIVQAVQENQDGKGRFDRTYRALNLPLVLVKTQLANDLTNAQTTITVDSTTGLRAGDYISIGSEAMLVDTVSSTTQLVVTRATLGSTAAVHSTDDYAVNNVVEVSTTPFGSIPVYNKLRYLKDYSVEDTGRIVLLHNDITSEGLFIGQYPERAVPDRFKFTYAYGSSSVPQDVQRAAILMTAEQLVTSTIVKGMAEGIDGLSSLANDLVDKEVKSILRNYRVLLSDGF